MGTIYIYIFFYQGTILIGQQKHRRPLALQDLIIVKLKQQRIGMTRNDIGYFYSLWSWDLFEVFIFNLVIIIIIYIYISIIYIYIKLYI